MKDTQRMSKMNIRSTIQAAKIYVQTRVVTPYNEIVYIVYRVSCIVYRVSCIVYRVSCIVYRVSCIVYHDTYTQPKI